MSMLLLDKQNPLGVDWAAILKDTPAYLLIFFGGLLLFVLGVSAGINSWGIVVTQRSSRWICGSIGALLMTLAIVDWLRLENAKTGNHADTVATTPCCPQPLDTVWLKKALAASRPPVTRATPEHRAAATPRRNPLVRPQVNPGRPGAAAQPPVAEPAINQPVVTPPTATPPPAPSTLSYTTIGSGTVGEDRYLAFDSRISVWVEGFEDDKRAYIGACWYASQNPCATDLGENKWMAPRSESQYQYFPDKDNHVCYRVQLVAINRVRALFGSSNVCYVVCSKASY